MRSSQVNSHGLLICYHIKGDGVYCGKYVYSVLNNARLKPSGSVSRAPHRRREEWLFSRYGLIIFEQYAYNCEEYGQRCVFGLPWRISGEEGI